MSPRPRATFSKRQKEQARQEKQRAKAMRKAQRKLENQQAAQQPDSAVDTESGETSLSNEPAPNPTFES